MTTSYCLARACSMPIRDTVTGSPKDRVPSPGVEDGVVAAHVAALGREDGEAGALADDLELGDGVRALEVGGDEERRVALVLEPLAELAGEGRLAGALQAGEHDDRRRLLGEADRARLPAEDRDELLLHDLDDLLGRVERLADLGAEGALAHRCR